MGQMVTEQGGVGGSGGSGRAPPKDGAAPPVVVFSVMKGRGVRQATGQGGLWRICPGCPACDG